MKNSTSWAQQQVERKFGMLKQHVLRFTWRGIVDENIRAGHFFLHQKPYLTRLKPITLVEKTADTAELCNRDHSSFRSLLMSTLWLTKTKRDILQEIVQSQTEMINPKGIYVKQLDG
eukprot:4507383-Pyramimonas_sp.AAC.1